MYTDAECEEAYKLLDADNDSYDSIYPYSNKRSAEDALPLLMVFHGFISLHAIHREANYLLVTL